jgi:hypothetical protein
VYDTRKNPLLSREPPTRRTVQNPRGRLPCMDSALHVNAPPVSGGPAHGARFVCVGNGSPSTSEPEPIVNTRIIRGGNPYLHEMCGQLGVRSHDTLCAVHQFPHARLVYTAELRQAIAAAIGTNFVRVSALHARALRISLVGPSALVAQLLLQVFIGMRIPRLQRPILCRTNEQSQR